MYMHQASLKRALGLSEKLIGKMPADFELGPREINGVWVYITKGSTGGNRSAGKHRVRAICPECGKHMSAGRLFQHRRVHGVKSDFRVVAPPVVLRKWSEMYPSGRWVVYEGDDPAGFRAEMIEKFKFDPAMVPDSRTETGFAGNDLWNEDGSWQFICPGRCMDDVYGGGDYPLGS